jgi:hypothetical protein
MTLAHHARRLARSKASALLVIGALAVGACGGSAASATPQLASTAPASAAPSSSGSGAGSGSGPGTGTCGEATAALLMKQLARADVVSVTTEGGCHDATIVTTLGPSDAKTALAICDAASLVAYAGDLSSVTVLAANSKELSIGIKGQPCIGEP